MKNLILVLALVSTAACTSTAQLAPTVPQAPTAQVPTVAPTANPSEDSPLWKSAKSIAWDAAKNAVIIGGTAIRAGIELGKCVYHNIENCGK